jgi:hypothetical protein
MKSRIVLMLIVSAFLNPISVMAVEHSSIACKEWANGKILAAETTAKKTAETSSSSRPAVKSARAN